MVSTGHPKHATHTHSRMEEAPIQPCERMSIPVAPSIGANQPNWSWDAELICIEQGFRVFSQQEDEDMGMGPLFALSYALYLEGRKT